MLLARHEQGEFLLRIEDTDLERSEQRYTDALMQDLRCLGYDWQEGPEHDGGRGPYWQSQRQAIYDRYYAELEAKALVYPCFCTAEELALSRKIQRAANKPPRYAGTCTHLTPAEVAEKIAAGLKPTLRFSLQHEGIIEFADLVRGPQRFNAKDMGDFIVRRADGTSPFMFCNAIDDSLMAVTHALRGEDHLTNTPYQIAILKALNLRAPQYGHINLIVGNDGSPLSKRHGSRSVQDLRAEGYLPLAINNYLARLGHHYSNHAFMSLEELATNFSTEALSRAPARFDAEQLNYWQKEAVQRLSPEEFWQWLAELKSQVPDQHQAAFESTIKPNIRFIHEAAEWVKILFTDSLQYSTEQQVILDGAGAEFFKAAQAAFAQHYKNYKAVIEQLQAHGYKAKALFQPLRVALTGQLHGPEMAPLLEMMDESLLQKRLNLQ